MIRGKNMNEDMSSSRVTSGIACIPCSIDHFMTNSALITGAADEGSRMATAGKGIFNKEVIERLGLARRELDVMERIDLTDARIMNMTTQEKNLAKLAKKMSADLRHDIAPTQLRTLDDLIRLSGKGTKYWNKIWNETWNICKTNPNAFACRIAFPAPSKIVKKKDIQSIIELEHKYTVEKQGKNRSKVLLRLQKLMNKKAGCGNGQIYDPASHKCLRGMTV
jgi:hypothetical protein